MDDKYYHTSESVKEYISLAKDVNGAQLIDKLKTFLPEESNVLELGTGPGSDFEILNKFYNVTGSDYSTEFIKHLESQFADHKFLHLDARTISTDNKFESIYSNKVLHHLKDDELSDSIKKQSDVLIRNGIVCHSFWKGEGYEIFKGMYVNYHTSSTIRKQFEPYFKILLLEEYKEFDHNDSLILIAEKKSS